jgi:hypothetical protein
MPPLGLEPEDAREAGTEVELRSREAVGDFLEQHLYEDWTVDCREATTTASRHLRRLLERETSVRDVTHQVL